MKYSAPDGAVIITDDPAKLEAFKAAHGEAQPEAFPKGTGGGWYELSNGERVQGKDAAQAAQDALDA
jgi:hypothetical protein